MDDTASAETPQISALPPAQRRVLGVLVEKGLTTPEYYPLTLNALVTGCNQKSNRNPVTNYDPEDVLEALDGLRKLGLAAVVHTESGRVERYRHYMRHRFTFTEPQLAVFTELLLRGRQTLGELRARASRMVPIETLEQLREELRGLMEMGLVQANGPLQRRGVLVDHTWYLPEENVRLEQAVVHEQPAPPGVERPAAAAAPASQWQQRVERLEAELQQTAEAVAELQNELRSLRQSHDELKERFERLYRELCE